MMEFYNCEQRKGRKEYRCELCGKPILKGREHIYESGKWDGQLFDRRRHIHCHALAEAYFDQAYDNEYTVDQICDWVSEVCSDFCQDEHEEEYDNCDVPVWECPRVFETLLHPQTVRAALESVEQNREDKA